ncbi:unnamed protein product [Caenorhabditis sp. 36 PRJEB53466]|nr:unnamed protein product [Caenorhabditis sp. 36 PRJEB53466]
MAPETTVKRKRKVASDGTLEPKQAIKLKKAFKPKKAIKIKKVMANKKAVDAEKAVNAKQAVEPKKDENMVITLVAQDGRRFVYRVRREAMMKAVMDSFAARTDSLVATLRFVNFGKRLNANDIIGSVVENDDDIEVFTEQMGG